MNMDEDEKLRGLPRDLMQDIKRAAYEAKVREMQDAKRTPPAPADANPDEFFEASKS
jgi:hypothetical protein